MIVVTGALGFIGSALLGDLERAGYGSLVAVDDFSHSNKFPNLENKNISQRVERELFLNGFLKTRDLFNAFFILVLVLEPTNLIGMF